LTKVQVEILGLSSSPSSGGAYALLLKETFGVRRLPIIIGGFEAQSIALELEGIKPPRPLTHDLTKSIIDHLGATVIEVLISELKENTYYAIIKLDVSSLTTDIDARPSDAIAIAVRTGAPIYVSEDVMREGGFKPSSESNIPGVAPDTSMVDLKSETRTNETRVADLQSKLREAIEKEDYERAAILRDKINRLTKETN